MKRNTLCAERLLPLVWGNDHSCSRWSHQILKLCIQWDAAAQVKRSCVGTVRGSHSCLSNCSDITVSVGPDNSSPGSSANQYVTEGLSSTVVQILQMNPDKGSDGSVHPKWALYLKTNGTELIKKSSLKFNGYILAWQISWEAVIRSSTGGYEQAGEKGDKSGRGEI